MNIFKSDHQSISFVTESGKLKLKCENHEDDVKLFDISVKNGNITLTHGVESIDYWGTAP